jgi:hypothetical protein
MRKYHKNPRTITNKQFADLRSWLAEFGDLSGIVHNLPTDEIISGNQRTSVLKQAIHDGRITITDEFDPPTKQGTVTLGYIEWEGERFSYRQVEWSEEKCEQANIIANKAGGNWDYDMLANQYDMRDLIDWGFTNYDFGITGEYDFSYLDDELEKLDGMQDDTIKIIVPAMHKERVMAWLANGEPMTGPGLGRGVMVRCGILKGASDD